VASFREALIAELIGRLEDLVKHVEVLPQTLDDAREAMNQARWDLHCQVDPLHHQMAAAIQQSKDIALKDIQVATYRYAADSMERQTAAMTQVARATVAENIEPSIKKLAGSLEELAQRIDRQWRWSWLTHGAAVLATASITSVAMLYVSASERGQLMVSVGPASGVASGGGVDLAPAGAAHGAARNESQFDSGLVHAQREGGRDREPRPRERAASSAGSTRYR
jgi:hypothetical protein